MKCSLAAVAAAFGALSAGWAADISHDPRPLRPAEDREFRLLLCGKPVLKGPDKNCARVGGYPGGGGNAPVHLDLAAISYGSFTSDGADQALVSYTGDFEVHANSWGGSILFERQGNRWRLVRWFPGTHSEECVALPGPRVALLCLGGWSGQGESDSSVWVVRVPVRGKMQTTPVLKAQDDTSSGGDEDFSNYQCTLPRKKDEGILFAIEGLKRSHQPGALAEAKITYALPDAVNRACRKHRLPDVHTLQAMMTFHLDGARVVADTPVKFAKADY